MTIDIPAWLLIAAGGYIAGKTVEYVWKFLKALNRATNGPYK